jgi:single-stranded-DNA-specific exonuclease
MMAQRPVDPRALQNLVKSGVPPTLARIYAARGIDSPQGLDPSLNLLLPPDELLGIEQASRLLADSIRRQDPICVVGDYDCDGATASAVAVRGIRMMGGRADFIVPNRVIHGYGLSPALVELARTHPELGTPRLIVTVDNGIASHEGVSAAHRAGIDVLVTDHHLPGLSLPSAQAIVNPNQPGCQFASKNLAGVGVVFYVLLATRALLRREDGAHPGASAPLQHLLDLVALGTVADLVKLDANNRRLVHAGLRRIRAGKACAGVQALFAVAGRQPAQARAADLGFALAPRINAAGRLADITLGIRCLLSDDALAAAEAAQALDSINRDRRELEQAMREQALEAVDDSMAARHGIVLHHADWHEGVVGLVATRLRERFTRPAFAFACAMADSDVLKGSGRSIPGVHLRDMLDLVDRRAPGLITRFGGHAMAAGLTLPRDHLMRFDEVLQGVLREQVDPACFDPTVMTDGELQPGEARLELLTQIESEVWGQGFPEPVFTGHFAIRSQRIVGERHLKLLLDTADGEREAIFFGRATPLPARAQLIYRLNRNDWRGVSRLEYLVEGTVDPGPALSQTL